MEENKTWYTANSGHAGSLAAQVSMSGFISVQSLQLKCPSPLLARPRPSAAHLATLSWPREDPARGRLSGICHCLSGPPTLAGSLPQYHCHTTPATPGKVYKSIQEYTRVCREYTRVYKSIQEYVEYVEYAEYTRFTHTSCRCNHNSITIISLLISAQYKLVRRHSINNVGNMQYLHHTWRKTTLNYKPLVTLSTVVSGHGGKYGRFKPTVVCCSHWCTPSGSPPPRERGLQCTTDWEWG